MLGSKGPLLVGSHRPRYFRRCWSFLVFVATLLLCMLMLCRDFSGEFSLPGEPSGGSCALTSLLCSLSGFPRISPASASNILRSALRRKFRRVTPRTRWKNVLEDACNELRVSHQELRHHIALGQARALELQQMCVTYDKLLSQEAELKGDAEHQRQIEALKGQISTAILKLVGAPHTTHGQSKKRSAELHNTSARPNMIAPVDQSYPTAGMNNASTNNAGPGSSASESPALSPGWKRNSSVEESPPQKQGGQAHSPASGSQASGTATSDVSSGSRQSKTWHSVDGSVVSQATPLPRQSAAPHAPKEGEDWPRRRAVSRSAAPIASAEETSLNSPADQMAPNYQRIQAEKEKEFQRQMESQQDELYDKEVALVQRADQELAQVFANFQSARAEEMSKLSVRRQMMLADFEQKVKDVHARYPDAGKCLQQVREVLHDAQLFANKLTESIEHNRNALSSARATIKSIKDVLSSLDRTTIEEIFPLNPNDAQARSKTATTTTTASSSNETDGFDTTPSAFTQPSASDEPKSVAVSLLVDEDWNMYKLLPDFAIVVKERTAEASEVATSIEALMDTLGSEIALKESSLQALHQTFDGLPSDFELLRRQKDSFIAQAQELQKSIPAMYATLGELSALLPTEAEEMRALEPAVERHLCLSMQRQASYLDVLWAASESESGELQKVNRLIETHSNDAVLKLTNSEGALSSLLRASEGVTPATLAKGSRAAEAVVSEVEEMHLPPIAGAIKKANSTKLIRMLRLAIDMANHIVAASARPEFSQCFVDGTVAQHVHSIAAEGPKLIDKVNRIHAQVDEHIANLETHQDRVETLLQRLKRFGDSCATSDDALHRGIDDNFELEDTADPATEHPLAHGHSRHPVQARTSSVNNSRRTNKSRISSLRKDAVDREEADHRRRQSTASSVAPTFTMQGTNTLLSMVSS
eukprot:GHVT01013212.1.p1 GENE.GHVT01013212.1~~GHVT01013212.1.p1  ORF type:complete len:934 (-),score=162.69 GHVT01013212.1:4359-7160(-)